MIKLEDLSCGYGKKIILNHVDACFQKDSINVIFGKNGCGKSTLLKTIAGLNKSYTGKIYVGEKNVESINKNQLAKTIAYMPQIRHIPSMSVEEFIMCARYPYIGMFNNPEKTDYIAVEEAMELVGIKDFRNRNLKLLSGGERQKVYFAFMLAWEAKYLLLDEPTTFLDVGKQFEILELIKILKNKGKTVVMVIHDICHGLKIADKIYCVNDGYINAFNNADELIESNLIQDIYNVKLHTVTIDGKKEYIIVK